MKLKFSFAIETVVRRIKLVKINTNSVKKVSFRKQKQA
jgi:hypothetical protein